MKKLYNDLLVR